MSVGEKPDQESIGLEAIVDLLPVLKCLLCEIDKIKHFLSCEAQ